MSPIFKDRFSRDPKRSEAYKLALIDHTRRWQLPLEDIVPEEREAMLVDPGTDPNSPDTGQAGRRGKIPGEGAHTDRSGSGSLDTVEVSDWAGDVRIHVEAPPRRPSAASISSSYSESHGNSWSLTIQLAGTLFYQSLPSILLSLFGLILSGQLLDHLARWPAFEQVDELFILFPVLSNLKGNLETCLGARLSTAAAQGLLDRPASRRVKIGASLAMLQFQALAISALAGGVAFFLGLTTDHRVADPAVELPMDGEVQLGYTRPGLKELGFVITVGMLTASLSSGVLGSFMTSLVVLARWFGVDPDNIVAPVAACLGDLLTLFILALVGALMVGLTHPLFVGGLAVVLGIATFGIGAFVTRQQRREQAAEMAKALRRRMRKQDAGAMEAAQPEKMAEGGWGPLIIAMFMSCVTGLVLDNNVNEYKGYALLGSSMTGICGGIGAIHASRLSTNLHLAEIAAQHRHPLRHRTLTPLQGAITLFLTSLPVQGCFLAFVWIAGWADLGPQLSLTYIGAYMATVAMSLALAHIMTSLSWQRRWDPDSYVLPVHSALVDIIGQLLLVSAYFLADHFGGDVKIVDLPASA